MARPGGAGPQPLASGHPGRGVACRPGSEFRVECREWTDAQIGNNDSANDVRDVDLTRRAHALRADRDRGRRARRPARRRHPRPRPVQAPQEYGDAPGQGWGYTGIFAKDNGGGFLTDHFPDAYKAIWDFHGQDATSRHIPGVRYTGITHPGLFGTAPSAELLAEWNRREQALIDTDPDRVPPLALPPLEDRRAGRDADAGPSSSRSPARGRGRSRRARTAATTTSRTSPAAPASTTRCTCRARSSPAATCTSPRATARSPSAARSRWAASSTSAST